MHTTNLRKVGGSVMLAIPPAFLELLQLQAGARVGVTVNKGFLIVEPQRRRRYTLKELLAQCDPKVRRTKEDKRWLSSRPAGDELI